MSEFDRIASGHRFAGIGLRVSEAADAMPPNRCPYCQNIRQYSQDHIRSRPQLQQQIAPPVAGPVLALEANLGYYNIGTSLYRSGASASAGLSGYGCTLLPFRPNASPQSWEYVYDSSGLLKIAPGNNPVPQGISEPQTPAEAAVTNWHMNWVNPSSTWGNTGVAGAVAAGTRTTESVVAVFNDPSGISGAPVTLQVAGTQQYQREMMVTINAAATNNYIRDVYTPLPSGLAVQSVTYYSGTTGRCVVVPNLVNPHDGSQPIYSQQFLATLRRGALVQIDSEVCIVWSVTVGPNDQICFETSTTATHNGGATLAGVPAIQVVPFAGQTIAAGQTITSADWSFAISGAGVGSVSSSIANLFTLANASFQEDDLVHISINISALENLNEIKLVLDVNNGAADFVSNAYFITIRPNDIQAGIQNALTQLGVAQLVTQRSLIDEEGAVEANGGLSASSSFQTATGENQWSEIAVPISAFTRIGNDLTRTINNTQAVQVLVNASGAIATVAFSSITIRGMFAVDGGATGIPVRYRFRPRSSVTGAKGNPSPEMRYGVSARREGVTVKLPTVFGNNQTDTWDIFRQGGALANYTYVASAPATLASFFDSFTDEALQGGMTLEENLYEPFPTVDYPFTGNATIDGTFASVTVTSSNAQANILRYLPGNTINIGQQVFTLRLRPTLISGSTYYFELVENAGVYSGSFYVYEPLMAAQPLTYAWGPDANGRIFAVGDTYRPGFVFKTNPNDPDSTSDDANEVCAPTEPLQNGALIGGTSVVASARRWWRGYPQDNGDYNWTEIPVGVGLEFPWAICSDGESVYFVGPDGIYRHSGGPAESLTNDDLCNLFPHEDVYPQTVSYLGYTLTPPGYQNGSSFRLAMVNGYLFFDYVDVNNARQTLVWNKRTKSWSKDVYSDAVTVRSSISSPPGVSGGIPSQQMLCGSVSGAINVEVSSPVAASGENVGWVIATAEEVFGDLRAPKLIGDISIDILPAGSGITANPTSLGSTTYGATAIPTSNSRTNPPKPISLGGGILQQSAGLLISGTDQGVVTRLYSWQPSYIIKPVWEDSRNQDWDNAGTEQNKFFQGFILEANTLNASKNLLVRDSDTLSAHDFTAQNGISNQVRFNGQSVQAFSFVTPFRAHSVRIEPNDGGAPQQWEVFGVRWIYEPTPEFAQYWTTQETGFGIDGYKHLQRVLFAYAASATVTLTIKVDGRSYAVTLPSTAGAYLKNEVILPPTLKGMVYTFSATSGASFAVWEDDIEILCRQWGDQGPYQRLRLLGSRQGATAKV